MPDRPATAPTPALSIGLPVYNGGACLADAIDALLAQDMTDFELIIADNASTDTTQAVCEAYAARDARVRYVRHAQNRGAEANFAFVLEAATAEFFMWAAADDRWSPDFAGANVAFLCANPAFAGSISPTRFDDRDFDPVWMGDGVLGATDIGQRVCDYVAHWHANSVIYSVWRRAVLAGSVYPLGKYLGYDWSVVLRATRAGPSKRIDAGSFVRGTTGASSTHRIFRASRMRGIHWLLPFYEVCGDVWRASRGARLRQRLAAQLSMLRLNASAFRAQLSYELRAGRA